MLNQYPDIKVVPSFTPSTIHSMVLMSQFHDAPITHGKTLPCNHVMICRRLKTVSFISNTQGKQACVYQLPNVIWSFDDDTLESMVAYVIRLSYNRIKLHGIPKRTKVELVEHTDHSSSVFNVKSLDFCVDNLYDVTLRFGDSLTYLVHLGEMFRYFSVERHEALPIICVVDNSQGSEDIFEYLCPKDLRGYGATIVCEMPQAEYFSIDKRTFGYVYDLDEIPETHYRIDDDGIPIIR